MILKLLLVGGIVFGIVFALMFMGFSLFVKAVNEMINRGF